MIDWTKPIEAVHEDGRVVSASFTGGVASDGSVWVYGDFHDGSGHWFSQKGWAKHTPYRIRNVQQPETAYQHELVERMVAFIREMSVKGSGFSPETNIYMVASQFDEARAIVAELPKPIDPALTEARKLAADFLLHGHGSEGVLDGALDHTPLVQTLVKAFKAGEAK